MATYMSNMDDASSIIVSMKKFESLLRTSMAEPESPASHEGLTLPKPFHVDDMTLIREMPSAECATD